MVYVRVLVMKIDILDWKILLRLLFWARGSVWVVLSYLFAVSYLGTQRNPPLDPLFIAGLLLLTAGIYFVLGWYMKKPTRVVWVVSLVFLISQVVLTVTDNMGMVDVFSLTVDGMLLILLYMWRDRFPKKLPGT